jgi:hypothetical protein
LGESQHLRLIDFLGNTWWGLLDSLTDKKGGMAALAGPFHQAPLPLGFKHLSADA